MAINVKITRNIPSCQIVFTGGLVLLPGRAAFGQRVATALRLAYLRLSGLGIKFRNAWNFALYRFLSNLK